MGKLQIYNNIEGMTFVLLLIYLYLYFMQQEVYNSLISYLPSIKGKCVTILNGINLEKLKFTYDVAERIKRPVILYVGSLCKKKNQGVLVKAMQYVKGNVILWLVGEEIDRAKLEVLVSDLSLQERVFLLGNRPDVPDLIKRTAIYVHPSLHEGLSIAILEVMAGGLPIIAPNALGMRELVRWGGDLFPSDNVDALSVLINNLLAQPKLLEELSVKSKRQAEKFSINKTVDDYCCCVYNNLNKK